MTKDMTSHKQYIHSLIILILALMVCVAAFSWISDPYGIFRSNIFPVKPTITRNARTAKAFQVFDYGADTIILGSSRTEAGLNPQKLDGRAYNLGLPGSNLKEQFAYLKHAHAAHPVKHLIFQPDFFAFNAFRENQAGFNQKILLDYPPSKYSKFQTALKKYALLINIDHVKYGISTIKYQNPKIIFGNLYFDNGFNDPEHRNYRVKMTGGAKESVEKGIAKYYAEIWFLGGKDSFAFEHDGYYSFTTFEEILKFAKTEGIDTKIILAPVHVWHLQALDIAGLWPLWIQWKERMVEINDRVSKFPLIDYSGYTGFTTETVPDGKDALMDWHLDNAHYRSELGDLILSGVASGSPLVSGRMPEYQKRENMMHEAYKTQHPTIIYNLKKIANESLPKD